MARVAIVGLGNRGAAYGRYALELGAEVTVVAEPNPVRRERVGSALHVPPAMRFADWQELLVGEPAVDVVFIATQDRLHSEPAIAFLSAGYDVMLEKPMAPSEGESRAIVEAAERAGRHLVVAHVLRYQPYSRLVMQLIADGVIGRVVHVDHFEPIGDQHFAHSYVRGNWRREDEASSALMSKSCHDLDWICAVMPSPAARVSSFGSLSHFRPEEAPAGSSERCLDCSVETRCAFSAKKFYLASLGSEDGWRWPLSVIADEPTEASVLEALQDGPYGRCVYRSDNNVVDHQVVAIEFEDGATANFTMSAFSKPGHRRTRIGGTKGYLVGDGDTVSIFDFSTQQTSEWRVHESGAAASQGHAGGDKALVESIVQAVDGGDWSLIPTSAHESFATHRLVWAAEDARRTGTVVIL